METYILIGSLAVALLLSLVVQWKHHKRIKSLENTRRYTPDKQALSILMCAMMIVMPSYSQSVQLIPVPAFGQVELPDGIPQQVQDQIQIILASQPLLSWTETFLAIAIVIVAGVILYCLWKCAKKLDEVPPQPKIPDDPAFAQMPSLVVYNLVEPTEACEVQWSNDLVNWTTFYKLTESEAQNIILSLPQSDKMFFRLEPVE